MSILDLNKNEALTTFNRHVPSGHIGKLKAASDAKNNTSELVQPNSSLESSRGAAARRVRERKDSLEIKALETQTDEDYFYSLLEGF